MAFLLSESLPGASTGLQHLQLALHHRGTESVSQVLLHVITSVTIQVRKYAVTILDRRVRRSHNGWLVIFCARTMTLLRTHMIPGFHRSKKQMLGR